MCISIRFAADTDSQTEKGKLVMVMCLLSTQVDLPSVRDDQWLVHGLYSIGIVYNAKGKDKKC